MSPKRRLTNGKMKEMYPNNPNSAESILTEKLKDISHGWFNDQRAIVLEAMQDYSNQQNAALIAALKESNAEIRTLKAQWIGVMEDNASAIAALKELIPIAERVLKHYPESAPVVEHFKSAIENAKSLITPQKEQTPQ